MRRSSRRFLLAANLFGVLLACGCRQTQPCCSDSDVSASYAPPPVGGSGPILHTVNKPDSANPAAPQDTATAPTIPAPNDGVPAPRFAHDVAYHQMTGTISYSRAQDAWLLRYAPFAEDDRYGGVVALTECGPMTGFKDGQLVRVEGELIDPGSRQLRPAFRVRNLAPAVP